eukprot:gnl/TRDRNA2_/TRDRNA2_84950_c0_seq1.p1 gnl/TRDRNA2_/TRDRNA2_84950_c0~~gnl/TRDRNA2_/TRDRNA2_84950_c0_seq1.p1  ORF type:complete len:244 (+),score=28.76 gnl/TRDRNA2_/TRDRNA2_84950_c0_seq1:44-733(+)
MLDNNSILKCNTQCKSSPMLSCTMDSKAPLGFLQQFHKLGMCYKDIEAAEVKAGVKFDWLVKLRSDMMFLEPLPDVRTLDAKRVYVPYGTLSVEKPRMLYNDHVFFCRRELCEFYFTLGPRYQRCTPEDPQGLFFRKKDDSQSVFVQYYKRRLETVYMAYILIRPHTFDCERLGYHKDTVLGKKLYRTWAHTCKVLARDKRIKDCAFWRNDAKVSALIPNATSCPGWRR